MAQITARFPSTCPTCSQRIAPGQAVEWTKGTPARHVSCGAGLSTPPPVARVVTYEQVGARVYILGDTFAIRAAIKSAGGHWDADRKAWWVGATKRAAIELAVSAATPTASEPRSYRPSRCKECGAPADRYRRIYRNGVCGDCYEDYAHGGMSHYDRDGHFVLGGND